MSRPATPAPGPGSYDFLTAPRWIGLIALMVAIAVACVFLGRWQWGRFEERVADDRQVDAAYDTPAVPIAELLTAPPGGGGGAPGTGAGAPVVEPEDEWRLVELTGTYVDGATVVLRNRPVDGTPAGHLITPFLVDAGAGRDAASGDALSDGAGVGTGTGTIVVLVDRGWLSSAEMDVAGAELPAPPSGEVTLTGRLRLPEEPEDRDRPAGQVYTITPLEVLGSAGQVADVSSAAGLPVLDGYVLGETESPPAAVTLGDYQRPSFNYGMNLSYAIQWWLFAIGAVLALVVLARREAAERAGRGPVRTVSRAEFEEDLEIYTQLHPATALPAGPGGRPGVGSGAQPAIGHQTGDHSPGRADVIEARGTPRVEMADAEEHEPGSAVEREPGSAVEHEP